MLRWCQIHWAPFWPLPQRPGQHLQAQVLQQRQLQRLARRRQAPLGHQVSHLLLLLAGHHHLMAMMLSAAFQEVLILYKRAASHISYDDDHAYLVLAGARSI